MEISKKIMQKVVEKEKEWEFTDFERCLKTRICPRCGAYLETSSDAFTKSGPSIVYKCTNSECNFRHRMLI